MSYRKNNRKYRYKKIKKDNKEIKNKIKFYERKCKYDSALSLIDEYLITNPNDNYMLVYKAMILFKLNRKEESISEFESILSKNDLKKSVRLFAMSQYATSLSLIDNDELAMYYFERVINESKDLELIARGKLSSLYTKHERYTDAINILNIDGFNNMFLNVRRAKAYAAQDNFYKSINALDKEEYNTYNATVKENLDDKFIEQEKNYVMGHAYFKLEKRDLAINYLSKACLFKNKNIYFLAGIDIVRILLLNNQIGESVKMCEELKKDCTSDYFLRIINELLAKSYSKRNDYEKAEELYKQNEDNSIDKRFINTNLGKIELLKGNFEKAEEYYSVLDLDKENIEEDFEEFYKVLLIKFRLKKYDEVLKIIEMFNNNSKKFEINQMLYELRRIKLYIEKEMNNKQINSDDLCYSEKQILSYDEKEAINHIKDHHLYNAKLSIFNDNIDIEKLFYEVKDLMTNDNIIYDSMFDRYMVKYPNVGFNLDNESIHQLTILTLPNTKDIITMYPCAGSESIFYLEELEVKDKPKVKRLSQIEKFNKKYGNN